jgi:hypothetical protein
MCSKIYKTNWTLFYTLTNRVYSYRVKQKTIRIGICCFSAILISTQRALRRKSKDWLAWNQDNVFKWGDSGEATNTNSNGLLFDPIGSRTSIYYTRTEHANNYTTDGVNYLLKLAFKFLFRSNSRHNDRVDSLWECATKQAVIPPSESRY